MEKVKVGPKGRIAIIPDGWERVLHGKCRHGDMYADTVTAKFHKVESEDTLLKWEDFDCLIRKSYF